METNMSLNIAKKNYCEKCDYKCSKQSDFNKHLLTRKHMLETNGNHIVVNNSPYICDICNKKYLNRSGLWKHKKKCSINQEETEAQIYTETPTTNNTIKILTPCCLV